MSGAFEAPARTYPPIPAYVAAAEPGIEALLIQPNGATERVELPADLHQRDDTIKELTGSDRELWHTLKFEGGTVMMFHGSGGEPNDLATKFQSKSLNWQGEVLGPVVLMSQDLEGWETDLDDRITAQLTGASLKRTLKTLDNDRTFRWLFGTTAEPPNLSDTGL